MQTITRLAIGAAAVIAVVAIGFGSGLGRPAVGTVPGPSASPTPSVTAPAASSQAEIPILEGQDVLDGRYRVDAGLPVGVEIVVPQGWRANGGWVVIGPGGNDAPDGMAIRFYTVGNVFKNPAVVLDGFIDGDVGPTVADLVDAIVGHPAWDASTPIDVTIDGHQGSLVSLTIPADAEFTSNGEFYLFSDTDAGRIWGFAPGQVFDLYILDVAGERIVIDAFRHTDTSPSDLQAQQDVLDSIRITAAP
jgi:hypothetical protein